MTAPKDLLLSIESVYQVRGRGRVAVCRVVRGKTRIGDEVDIVTPSNGRVPAQVKGIEMNRSMMSTGHLFDRPGDLIGIIVGADADESLAAGGSIEGRS
jgi:elongation factor Tu